MPNILNATTKTNAERHFTGSQVQWRFSASLTNQLKSTTRDEDITHLIGHNEASQFRKLRRRYDKKDTALLDPTLSLQHDRIYHIGSP